MPSFPIAPKRPYEITQHGSTRVDDYFWLRYREDPEVLKYLTAQNDYLDEVMGHTRSLQETLFAEMKGRIKETDSTVPEKRGGYLYYTRTEAGKQYPIFCRRKDSPDNAEEILLDQNELAEGKVFCSVSAFSVSPDGKKLAYGLDVEGNEIYIIHIKDLTNGAYYPKTIENTFGSVYIRTGIEWANDSESLFYVTLDSAQRPYKLCRHQIGSDPSLDVMIFHEVDNSFYLYFHKSRDDVYILTDHHSTLTSEMRLLSADDPTGELKAISSRKDGVEYFAAYHEGHFFIATNEDAQNFKLMKASISNLDRDQWQEVLPHRADVMLEWIDTFKDYLVLYERRDGLKQIRISASDGINNVRYVDFPEEDYCFELESNPEYDTNILRFKYSSLITPFSIIDYHMDTGEWELKKEDEIPSGYDKSQFISQRIYATAADGKQIPISIAHRKDLKMDGGNPTLLHGYGAYGAVLDAEFTPNRLSLLDRGFIYAIAHIRGGSDLGRAWYDDGKVLQKKNSFTDFIACAEHLIKEGYTSKDKLAIYGVSAGGLLVNASMVMRPDLFKAVIGRVPFVDVVNSISDPSIPLTTLEYDEWGNTANKDHYDYMMSYSPYDNIRATEYPNILLIGGLNDPRVAYWEPAKFAAKLFELKTDNNLLLLKTNLHAGHAGASGRYDFLKDVAFEYAFLIDRLLAGDGHI
ncbi:MAG: S9 family peptidase [Anaerolineae bacterium]|nr:S9 family peptidase [Anaerolineae bacterium]MCI0610425.1 S9 family peptidase [Anaerolineae bacterium]